MKRIMTKAEIVTEYFEGLWSAAKEDMDEREDVLDMDEAERGALYDTYEEGHFEMAFEDDEIEIIEEVG
jgi:hypothetical protein